MDDSTSCESTSCTLRVTRLGEKGNDYITRKDAYAWGAAMVQDICAKADVMMEGELQVVIPCRQVTNGFLYKFAFSDVPNRLMRDFLSQELRREVALSRSKITTKLQKNAKIQRSDWLASASASMPSKTQTRS